MRYSIANPVEGEALSFDYDTEWLRSIVAEAGNIKISVDAIDSAERTAEVVVGYKGAESITLSVKQEAAAPEAISVVIEELTGNPCITAVTPVDPEMYYVMYKSDLSYFLDNNLLTAEALFDDDMFYFKRGAEFDGISLKKYMERNKVLFQGRTRAAWPGIRPGEQSVIYAYGVKFNEAEDDCEMITSIAWSMIEPPLAERRTIDFDDEYFLMWIEVKTDIPTPEIFTLFVDVPTYNDLGEDLIFFDLLFDTCEPLITKTASYNMPYYLCAAAFDHKGDVTPMWRSEVIKYAPSEGKSAQELIDKLNSSTRAQAMVVDRHSGKVVAVR